MRLKGVMHLWQAGRRGPRHLSASAAWRCQAELRRPKPGMRAWMAKHRACVEAASRLRVLQRRRAQEPEQRRRKHFLLSAEAVARIKKVDTKISAGTRQTRSPSRYV